MSIERFESAERRAGSLYFPIERVTSFYECELIGRRTGSDYRLANVIETGVAVLMTGTEANVDGCDLVEVIYCGEVRYVFLTSARERFERC